MAATPLAPRVLDAMGSVAGLGGNPSSSHGVGRAARRQLETAGDAVRALLCAPRAEVVWTASGAEPLALAFVGLARARRAQGCTQVCAPVATHPTTHACLAQLRAEGWNITKDIQSLNASTAVLMLEAVSLEGAALSLPEPCAAARAAGVPVHVAAHAGVGEISCDFAALGLDACSLWGHKLGGPAGVGAVLLRKGVHLPPLWQGGGQQRGMRPGTEAVPLIVGMGTAAASVAQRVNPQWRVWSADLEAHARALSGAWVPERAQAQLSSVARVGVFGLSEAALSEAYGVHGVMVGHGEQGTGVVRLSLGHTTCAEDIDRAKAALAAVVRTSRA